MGYSALIVYAVGTISGLALARIVYVSDVRAKRERNKKGMYIEW